MTDREHRIDTGSPEESSLIEGLPDRWKLYQCSATNRLPDFPGGKWRDADILKLLKEIAALHSTLLYLAHQVFGSGENSEPDVYADYDRLCELKAAVDKALKGESV